MYEVYATLYDETEKVAEVEDIAVKEDGLVLFDESEGAGFVSHDRDPVAVPKRR